MKPLTFRVLIKVLEGNGFVLVRRKGSHHIYKHLVSGTQVSVPLHGQNKPIHIGTFLAIVKHSGLPRKLFDNI